MDILDSKTVLSQDEVLEKLGIQPLSVFKHTREELRPTDRLETVKRRAIQFREFMLSGSEATYLKTVDLVKAPYPTKFAYLHAVKSRVPYILLGNKMFIVQCQTANGLKNLLFGINDVVGNGETPFFKRIRDRAGWIAKSFIEPELHSVKNGLAATLATHGLAPEDIDYITFDHLHVQELRHWLGSSAEKGFFPNAKLLVMQQEWESAHGLLPIQAPWYCPNGTAGIPLDRVVTLDSSVMIGQGVALVQTPGHTEGNHSLVVHINGELFVSSENGMSADSYSPLRSRIPGLKQYAATTGSEVILNGNTLENSIDQYISMVMEKTIAGGHREYSGFSNVIPSSEHAPMWFSATVNPTVQVSQLEFGKLLNR